VRELFASSRNRSYSLICDEHTPRKVEKGKFSTSFGERQQANIGDVGAFCKMELCKSCAIFRKSGHSFIGQEMASPKIQLSEPVAPIRKGG
jgi:hypothetical protein